MRPPGGSAHWGSATQSLTCLTLTMNGPPSIADIDTVLAQARVNSTRACRARRLRSPWLTIHRRDRDQFVTCRRLTRFRQAREPPGRPHRSHSRSPPFSSMDMTRPFAMIIPVNIFRPFRVSTAADRFGSIADREFELKQRVRRPTRASPPGGRIRAENVGPRTESFIDQTRFGENAAATRGPHSTSNSFTSSPVKPSSTACRFNPRGARGRVSP